MSKIIHFLSFRVNKRPTNVSADDWLVKCYENGMNHRLNRLLNPTFNNKNMEVRYCFLASFRLKLAKNGIFVANMYIFCDFSRFATTFAEVEKLKKPHGDRPANQILWGVEVCRHNLTKTYCLFAKFETFANPHLFCPQGRQKLWHGTRTLSSYTRAQDLKWSYGRGYYDTPDNQS